MRQGVTTGQKTRLAAKTLRLGCMVEIMYAPTPLRAWTGTGDLTYDGKTFHGVGNFGSITAIQERSGQQAGNVTLTLSGVPTELVLASLDDASQGKVAQVWLVTCDEPSPGVWTVPEPPVRVFKGRTDVHKLTDTDNGTSVIEVTVESFFARLRHPRTLRYTDADHQRRFPGDLGMQWAATIGERPINWGIAPAPGTYAGGLAGSTLIHGNRYTIVAQ